MCVRLCVGVGATPGGRARTARRAGRAQLIPEAYHGCGATSTAITGAIAAAAMWGCSQLLDNQLLDS